MKGELEMKRRIIKVILYVIKYIKNKTQTTGASLNYPTVPFSSLFIQVLGSHLLFQCHQTPCHLVVLNPQ